MEQNIACVSVEVRMFRTISTVLPKRPALSEPFEIREARLEDAKQLSELCGRAYTD